MIGLLSVYYKGPDKRYNKNIEKTPTENCVPTNYKNFQNSGGSEVWWKIMTTFHNIPEIAV